MNDASKTYLFFGIFLIVVGIVMIVTNQGHRGLAYGDIGVGVYILYMAFRARNNS